MKINIIPNKSCWNYGKGARENITKHCVKGKWEMCVLACERVIWLCCMNEDICAVWQIRAQSFSSVTKHTNGSEMKRRTNGCSTPDTILGCSRGWPAWLWRGSVFGHGSKMLHFERGSTMAVVKVLRPWDKILSSFNVLSMLRWVLQTNKKDCTLKWSTGQPAPNPNVTQIRFASCLASLFTTSSAGKWCLLMRVYSCISTCFIAYASVAVTIGQSIFIEPDDEPQFIRCMLNSGSR